MNVSASLRPNLNIRISGKLMLRSNLNLTGLQHWEMSKNKLRLEVHTYRLHTLIALHLNLSCKQTWCVAGHKHLKLLPSSRACFSKPWHPTSVQEPPSLPPLHQTKPFLPSSPNSITWTQLFSLKAPSTDFQTPLPTLQDEDHAQHLRSSSAPAVLRLAELTPAGSWTSRGAIRRSKSHHKPAKDATLGPSFLQHGGTQRQMLTEQECQDHCTSLLHTLSCSGHHAHVSDTARASSGD